MFGSKLKTWMENHIGLPKKKSHQEKEKCSQNGGRGIFLDSSDSLAQSDTGISSGSQQVLSSSTTDNKDGYCTTTMESDRSGMTHCHTVVSLPSPESAYSTGYSTDGASPGGTGPPEYYINIRTGKHYFPSPAPTPTSPQPNTTFASVFTSPGQRVSTSFLAEDSSLPPIPPYPRYSVASSHVPPHLQNEGSVLTAPPCIKSRVSTGSQFSNGFSPSLNGFLPPERSIPEVSEAKPNTLSTSVPSYFEIFNFSKSPCKKTPPKSQLSSLKLFLKSPKQDKGKSGKSDVNKTPTFENKKRILSPTKNKKWYKQPFQKFGQRRPDVCEESNVKNETKKDVYIDKNLFYLTKDNTSSPRQRNRIRTNPWLPTEPMSSQNFHNLQINFSPSLVRNRSCTNTPLQNRKTNEVESLQNRIKQMNVKYEESKDYLNNLEKVVNRHMAQKLYLELSDHSEEDLTLNEMMGTYNESYVYEKETDILSDSDPTDCEDYVSDSEADNGGDEQDSHDDELDFIDNGSITESEDNFAGNTGKCTYHDVIMKKNSFLYKNDRHHSRKDAECRRSLKKELESKSRRSKDDKKKRMARRSLKSEGDKEETRRRVDEDKMKMKNEINENVGGLNLGRVLMQRMMAKNGSKSAEGTPESVRRQKLMRELRETHIGNEKPIQECSGPANKELFLVDIEADKRYRELMMEAENMFESMQKSPIVSSRKVMEEKERKTNQEMEPLEIWRKAETMCCPQYPLENSIKKSPKTLGLKLRVEETPKKLDFGKDKKSSFKAKSSAHSPLDPLGPTFRNFAVFKPVKISDEKTSTSSSDEYEPQKSHKRKTWDFPKEPDTVTNTPGSPIVPIAFQSIDLGKPLTSYCPQSEPVKRKIYSCSKTYDKLVKQFETKPKIFEESEKGRTRHGSLMTRKRTEMDEGKTSSSCRGLVKSERGNQGPGLKGQNEKRRRERETANGDSLEKYFYSRAVYSPRLSPRRSSMPSTVASPNPSSQRHSFNMDAFR